MFFRARFWQSRFFASRFFGAQASTPAANTADVDIVLGKRELRDLKKKIARARQVRERADAASQQELSDLKDQITAIAEGRPWPIPQDEAIADHLIDLPIDNAGEKPQPQSAPDIRSLIAAVQANRVRRQQQEDDDVALLMMME